MTAYTQTTEGITVSVRPVFLDSKSDAVARKFVFAYFIRIENHSDETIQILNRHWRIYHSTGKYEEVEGEGVVGKQPVIAVGEYHEYNSFCILECMLGYMEGSYGIRKKDGSMIDIAIPRFTLRAAAN